MNTSRAGIYQIRNTVNGKVYIGSAGTAALKGREISWGAKISATKKARLVTQEAT